LLRQAPANEVSAADAAARLTVAERLGPFVSATITTGSIRPLFPWGAAGLASDERVHLRFYDRDLARFEDHVAWIAGSWPTDSAIEAAFESGIIPVVIGRSMAGAYGLSVGDRLPVSRQANAKAPEFWYEVAGIVTALDATSPYWFGAFSPLRAYGEGPYAAEYTVLLSEASATTVAQRLFPETEIALAWHVILNHADLRAVDAPALAQHIAAWRSAEATSGTGALETAADETLLAYEREADVVRAPIALVMLVAIGLALYYIVLINAISLRQLQPELALLAGRGVSGRRVALWSAAEVGSVALLAAVLAVPLSRLAVGGVALWGPLAGVRDPSWGLPRPTAVWAAAATGALIAVAVSLGSLSSDWRRSLALTFQESSRPARDPWWMRAYVDVMLLLAGAVLVWRVRLTGAFLIDANPAGIYWLLILAPILLLAGAAIMLLRAYPLLAAALGIAAERWPGLPPVLALRHSARQPHDAARLLLLLTLAFGLGLFAAVMDRTLARNEAERARYAAVGQTRMALVGSPPKELPVGNVTTTWRSEGALGATLRSGTERFELLALDPAGFNAVADYRDDFAGLPVAQLLLGLQAALPESYVRLRAVPVPGKPDTLVLHVWTDEAERSAVDGFAFDLKLRTAGLEPLTVRLTAAAEPDEAGWTRFSGSVPTLPEADYPLALTSFWWRTGESIFVRPDRPPTIDTLRALEGQTDRHVTDFEVAEGRLWFATYAGMYPYYAVNQKFTGQNGLALALRYENTAAGLWYGFNLNHPAEREPLPVVVTRPFATVTGSDTGAVVTVRVRVAGSGAWIPLPIRIAGIVDYFPSLDDTLPAGSVIALRDPLLRFLNAYQRPLTLPNELIMLDGDPVALEPLIAGAATVWDADAIELSLRANPLALGLRTVTLFGAIVAIVLSLAGFTTHFLLRAAEQARGYAVLRALGLSVRQLYVTLLLEHLLLIAFALAFGTGLGVGLTRMALNNLPFQLGAVAARPPFEPVIDWMAASIFVAVLALTFGVSLLLATASLWRADIHRVLRVGEE
jgi:hypothetical protein